MGPEDWVSSDRLEVLTRSWRGGDPRGKEKTDIKKKTKERRGSQPKEVAATKGVGLREVGIREKSSTILGLGAIAKKA